MGLILLLLMYLKKGFKMNTKNNNKKETKKQIKVDEKLKELERKEREMYSSRSWRRITSDGFYNHY